MNLGTCEFPALNVEFEKNEAPKTSAKLGGPNHILPHGITWLKINLNRMAAELLEPQPGALKDAKISNTTAKVLQSFARM